MYDKMIKFICNDYSFKFINSNVHSVFFTNVIKCQLTTLSVWLNKVKSCKIPCFVLKIPLRQY